jgi:dTDP-4-amino-4,6-dideoxygalactose transaminase
MKAKAKLVPVSSEKARIPYVDLCTPAKKEVLGNIFRGLEDVFNSSRYILGNEVAEFETKFARVAGCEYGVGVNSGLDALILALRALGVGNGDEVITVPNSYVATAAAIALVGAKPVFVDIASDLNMDPEKLEGAINKRTKAIIPVHLTGNPCKMDDIMAIARKHGVKVIEDAAQAIGATFENKPVGSIGDVGCFSLHPLKNLHVWGDGGMITTNDRKLADALRMQRNHGHKNRDEVEFFSYNSRLDTVHAVVGLQYLKLLEDTIRVRTEHAKTYDSRFSKIGQYVTTPTVDRKARHVFHVYVIKAKKRDELAEYLLDEGIETKIHYPIPIHLQKAASHLGYKKGDFPMTEKIAAEMMSIPIRENLSDEDLHLICDKIEAFYK